MGSNVNTMSKRARCGAHAGHRWGGYSHQEAQQRSDKGTKRKRPTAAVEEEEEEEEGEDDEVPPPAKKKKLLGAPSQKPGASKAASTAKKSKVGKAAKTAQRIARTLPPTAPKSRETIDSDSDVSDS